MNILRSKLTIGMLIAAMPSVYSDIDTTCYYGHKATVKTQDIMQHFLESIGNSNNVRDQAIKKVFSSIKNINYLDELKYAPSGCLNVYAAHKTIEENAEDIKRELLKQHEPYLEAINISEAFARNAKHVIGKRLERGMHTINKDIFNKELSKKKHLILNKNFRDSVRDLKKTLCL